MKRVSLCRLAGFAAAILASAPGALPQAVTGAPETGATFQCQDSSKMILTFAESGNSIDAVVWVHGVTYRLPYQEPKPGPVQVVWSDGDHSLTWSPGVQLMWMDPDTHLMCGRGGHKH